MPCGPHGFRLVGFLIPGAAPLADRQRVVCFIDGFNLYHSIDDLGDDHLKWVDLWALSEVFIKKTSQRLENVYYFSAYADWLPASGNVAAQRPAIYNPPP